MTCSHQNSGRQWVKRRKCQKSDEEKEEDGSVQELYSNKNLPNKKQPWNQNPFTDHVHSLTLGNWRPQPQPQPKETSQTKQSKYSSILVILHTHTPFHVSYTLPGTDFAHVVKIKSQLYIFYML